MLDFPNRIGRYALLEPIEAHAVAPRFLARALGSERLMAIMLTHVEGEENFFAMLVDELSFTIRALRHRNLLQFHEVGIQQGVFFLSMEYVPGQTLQELLEHGRQHDWRLPVAQAVSIAASLCEAMEHAHRLRSPDGRELGMVLRSPHPQRIQFSYNGAVKLIGLREWDLIRDRTGSWGALPPAERCRYLSPEHVRAEVLNRQSDLFCLGTLLYEMLTGQPAFTGEKPLDVLQNVKRAQVTPPRQLAPHLPAALEEVVLRLLARSLEHRPTWASEVRSELLRALPEAGDADQDLELAQFLQQTFALHLQEELERLSRYSVWRPGSAGGV